jgi:hypothetical protein
VKQTITHNVMPPPRLSLFGDVLPFKTHTHTSRIAIHEQILFYFYVFIFVFIYLFLVAPVLRGHGELGAIGPGSTMLSRQNEPKR